MSWDANLVTACCGVAYGRDFGYTYNTTPMVAEAAKAIGMEFHGFQSTLNGMDGIAGRDMLNALADEMERNAATYETMNPPNGWGDRAGIVEVMRGMAALVPGSPATVWRVT